MKDINKTNISKIEKSNVIAIILFFPILIMVITGLVLTLRFHPSHGTLLELWGLSRELWRQTHIISASISTLLVLIHLVLVKKRLYKVITCGKVASKSNKASRNLFWLFTITLLTGFASLVEIHDKLGLILVVIIILHIVYKWKSIVAVSKRVFLNKFGA